MSGKSNLDVFEHVQRDNRILLTNDMDFFSLIEKRQHSGLLYLTTQGAPVGRIIGDIVRLIDKVQPEEFENSLFYLLAVQFSVGSCGQ